MCCTVGLERLEAGLGVWAEGAIDCGQPQHVLQHADIAPAVPALQHPRKRRRHAAAALCLAGRQAAGRKQQHKRHPDGENQAHDQSKKVKVRVFNKKMKKKKIIALDFACSLLSILWSEACCWGIFYYYCSNFHSVLLQRHCTFSFSDLPRIKTQLLPLMMTDDGSKS